MRTTFISRVALMFLLVFSSWFVLATFSYGSEAGEETVCLRKPNAEELAIVIRHGYEDIKEYKKMLKDIYNQETILEKTIDVTVLDINNDNKPDIVFTDLGRTGSCGNSWDVLINAGNGRYKMIRIFDCTGTCITFMKKMENGFRMARIDGTVFVYDAKNGGYVDRKGRR